MLLLVLIQTLDITKNKSSASTTQAHMYFFLFFFTQTRMFFTYFSTPSNNPKMGLMNNTADTHI